MKFRIVLMTAVIAVFLAPACSVSFTTANISSFSFGKNEKAEPATTSFNTGEQVFAVTNVANAMGKYKMKYRITPPGGSAVDKDLDFEGSRSINYNFTPSVPGEYKFEVSLMDESGKEIDKKSGSITVKGEAPAADKPAADGDDQGDEKDEKPAGN
jgi:hypothetical protein